MTRLAAIILTSALLTGCTTNRPTYTEAPAAPEVYIILLPTCTAWHACEPTETAACAAQCCREGSSKPRWFE